MLKIEKYWLPDYSENGIQGQFWLVREKVREGIEIQGHNKRQVFQTFNQNVI